jgi:hypothetical protein
MKKWKEPKNWVIRRIITAKELEASFREADRDLAEGRTIPAAEFFGMLDKESDDQP